MTNVLTEPQQKYADALPDGEIRALVVTLFHTRNDISRFRIAPYHRSEEGKERLQDLCRLVDKVTCK